MIVEFVAEKVINGVKYTFNKVKYGDKKQSLRAFDHKGELVHSTMPSTKDPDFDRFTKVVRGL